VDCSAPSPWDCVDVKVPLSGSTDPRRTLGLDQPLRSWRASNGLISVRRPIHRWHTHRARTGALLEAHGESLVVWIEDEVLGYGGPIQAIARGGQHVLARIRRQPLRFRPPREGPDPSVDVGAFLGRHVERVPAAGLVGVRKIIDRELRTDREVTRVPGLGLRDPEELAVRFRRLPHRRCPGHAVLVRRGERHVAVRVDDRPRDGSEIVRIRHPNQAS
jgi:hypothetical protein